MHALAPLLLCLAALGCGSSSPSQKPLDPAVLAGLERACDGLEEANPAELPRHLTRAMAETGLLAAACGEVLDDVIHANPAQRQAEVARAWETCSFACPSRATFTAMENLPPAEAAPAAAADCDRLGPDRIFGTDAAAREGSLLRGTYFVPRFLVDTLAARLAADGSSRATALWTRYAALLPRLRAALADAR